MSPGGASPIGRFWSIWPPPGSKFRAILAKAELLAFVRVTVKTNFLMATDIRGQLASPTWVSGPSGASGSDYRAKFAKPKLLACVRVTA